MNAGVAIWPSGACLISELADELAALPPAELRQAEVILPTKRLGNWLLALLAQRRSAFVPPRFHNFDSFVAEHARRLGDPRDGMAVASDLEQELLLAGMLEETRFKHLRLGHEHEIKQFFAELGEWGVAATAFDDLRRAIATDIIRSELTLDTLTERVNELETLYLRLQERLAGLGAETATTRAARHSAALAEALASGAYSFKGRVVLAGFTSIGGLHQALLKTLARLETVSLWLSEPPELNGERNPLGMIVAALDAPSVLRAPRHLPQVEPHMTVRAAPSVLDEVAEALRLVEGARAAGVPDSLIAILVTSDTAYGKPLRSLLRGHGLGANLAIGTPLAETALGTWIAAAVELLQADNASALLALCSHPLSLAWWQARHAALFPHEALLPPELRREALARELCALGKIKSVTHLLAERRLSAGLSAYVGALWERLDAFHASAAPQPLTAWALSLEDLVNDIATHAPQRREGDSDFGVAESAREAAQSFCKALTRAAAYTRVPIRPRGLLTLIQDKLLTLDVRSVGDQLSGVQVLSVAEARYVPFAYSIILGCSEGQFPRALPKDHLVDNYLKGRIGLPGWQLLEAIEDTTFHLLKARLPQLTLLYPERRSGDLVVRSRFIESLLSAGTVKLTRGPADESLLRYLHKSGTLEAHTAGLRLAERHGSVGRFGGRATALLSTMSATGLEQLIRCPYRYLLSRCGVRDLALPDADDTRAEGDILHDVLEAFFTGRVGPRVLAEPLDPSRPWEDFAAYALKRLADLTDALAPAALRESPTYLQLKLRSWPAFVEHLMKLYDATTIHQAANGLRELALGDGTAFRAAVAVDGQGVELSGSVDSVDRIGEQLHLITDYKRRAAPERSEVRSGLSPQLLLYAVALSRLEGRRHDETAPHLPLERAIAGYWNILKGEWTPALAGSAALGRAKALGLVGAREAETLEDATGRLLAHWAWRHQEIVHDHGSFQPDASRCGFCRLAGVCRKDDPALGAALKATLRLEQRLSGEVTA